MAGKTYDADERQDELAFALLAERAKYPATIFDLRPLRSKPNCSAKKAPTETIPGRATLT